MCIFFSKYVWNNKIEKITNKIKNIEHMKKKTEYNMNHKYNQKRNGS